MASTAQPKPRPQPQPRPQTQRHTHSQSPTSAQTQSRSQAREAERLRETSQAAQKSLEAQRKAQELIKAAAACGDPKVRQKLLNEALEKEVEAETFGKTARYLQTGAFQGLCAGAGLGGGIGVSLGVITGTLVGGLTSPITGGVGAGLGLGIGAMHGPWFRMGDLMGGAIRKITGDWPGWKATEEQKRALERMVYGVQEQERPEEEELIRMTEDAEGIAPGKGYTGRREEDEKEKGMLRGAKEKAQSIPRELNPMSRPKGEGGGSMSKSKTENVQSGQTVQRPATNNLVREDLAGKAVTPNIKQSTSYPEPHTEMKPQQTSMAGNTASTSAEKAFSGQELELQLDLSEIKMPAHGARSLRLQSRTQPNDAHGGCSIAIVEQEVKHRRALT